MKKEVTSRLLLVPRIIRFRDAPHYLGMDRNRFNGEVRPNLTEVPIGTQGIGFDRLELDAWVEDYIARNGRPGRKGEDPWDVKNQRASSVEAGFGTSRSRSGAGPFDEALARINLKKPK